jgi:hypothetical protein
VRFTTQNAFDWLDSTRRRSQLQTHNYSPRSSQSEHHFHSRFPARLVRALDPSATASPDHRRHRSAADYPEMMPLTNLCNRLVVTSTRRTPNPQALGFRLSDPRNNHCLLPFVPKDSQPWATVTTTLDSRCRHLQPWVAARLTPRKPTVVTFTAPFRDNRLLGHDPQQRFQPVRAR